MADALADNQKPNKRSTKGVTFFEVKRGQERILVCSALGHLYTIDVKDSSRRSDYPVWDFAWKPKHLVEKDQQRSARWIEAIAQISKEADRFVSACDYDLEGSLIGYTILKYACDGADKKAQRMKFSTLTKKDLAEAYGKLLPELDYPMVYAGMCRHEVDWLYGINLSRALTQSAFRYSQRYATLSTGRVQGPTLRFVVEREKEIGSFVPTPFWVINATVEVNGKTLLAEFQVEKFEVKNQAERVVAECTGKNGVITSMESRKYRLAAPTPFDLSALQAEAYGHFGYTPRVSLGIAERLYLDALISYPRTSSQKLPPTIDYRDILQGLRELPELENSANYLLSLTHLRPREGKKDDPAHPAIYPTGAKPRRVLEGREWRLFDLVAKRFFATFGSIATKQSDRAIITVGEYMFYLRGSRILEKGWLQLYEPYAKFEEVALPPLEDGDNVKFLEISLEAKFTQPPPRYNPSSLLKTMEDAEIGTKATRAEIVETLYRRGYVEGERIAATPLAFRINDLLMKYCPKVIDVGFTRELEQKMEGIEAGTGTRDVVVLETVRTLRPIIEELKAKELDIGKELSVPIRDVKTAEVTLRSPCPKCASKLIVIRNRATHKRFIGCTGYRTKGCKFGLPVPQAGMLRLLERNCPDCGFQLVEARRKGSRPLRSCPQCFASKRKAQQETVEKPPELTAKG